MRKDYTLLILEILSVYIVSRVIFISISDKIHVEGFESAPTFHILIATAGRPSLKNLLDSLKNELTENDAITIVFDGDKAKAKSEISSIWFSAHKSKINIIEQTPNLGFWGHGIRNKYQSILEPNCTFVMHADDDDTYVPGSFAKLRKTCKNPDTLYIAKMERIHPKNKEIIPSLKQDTIKHGDIGTPNGIVPSKISSKGEWGHFYGGDFHYYNGVSDHADVVFLEHVIYTVTVKNDK